LRADVLNSLEPMTILAAVEREDSILFAGDGRGTQGATTTGPPGGVIPLERVCKVRPTALPGLKWSYAGASVLGAEVGRWLEGRRFDDWESLQEDTRLCFADIVKRTKTALSLTGCTLEDSGMLTDIVFAGYVYGESKIAYLPTDCVWRTVEKGGVCALNEPRHL